MLRLLITRPPIFYSSFPSPSRPLIFLSSFCLPRNNIFVSRLYSRSRQFLLIFAFYFYTISVRLNIRITVTKVRFFFSFRRYNSDKVSFASVLVILFLRLNKYDSYNNWSLKTHKCPSLPSLRVLKKPGQLKQREVIDSISPRFMSSQLPHLQRKFPFERGVDLSPFHEFYLFVRH